MSVLGEGGYWIRSMVMVLKGRLPESRMIPKTLGLGAVKTRWMVELEQLA
jgi:hypothetical protein